MFQDGDNPLGVAAVALFTVSLLAFTIGCGVGAAFDPQAATLVDAAPSRDAAGSGVETPGDASPAVPLPRCTAEAPRFIARRTGNR